MPKTKIEKPTAEKLKSLINLSIGCKK